MLTEELKVYRDTYSLMNVLLDLREHFPKTYKYSFGDRLFMTALDCCELIQCANSSIAERYSYLDQFNTRFGTLRLLIRLCRDRKLINLNQYAEITLRVGEIGKEIKGWQRASRKPEL
jgi:hypothetical protein